MLLCSARLVFQPGGFTFRADLRKRRPLLAFPGNPALGTNAGAQAPPAPRAPPWEPHACPQKNSSTIPARKTRHANQAWRATCKYQCVSPWKHVAKDRHWGSELKTLASQGGFLFQETKHACYPNVSANRNAMLFSYCCSTVYCRPFLWHCWFSSRIIAPEGVEYKVLPATHGKRNPSNEQVHICTRNRNLSSYQWFSHENDFQSQAPQLPCPKSSGVLITCNVACNPGSTTRSTGLVGLRVENTRGFE